MFSLEMPGSICIIYFYRPQRSCGKVILLHLSVILFTAGEGGGSVQGVSVQERGSFFFKKNFVGHMSICGATDTPVLDFW